MANVQVRAPDGTVVNVEEQNLRQAIDAGYRVISPDEAHRDYIAEKYGSTGDVLAAGLSSAASTATFGLSDVLLSQSPSIRKALQAYKELYPEAETVGGIAGALVPSPGSFLGGLAEKGITKLAGEGASLGARALATGGGLAARGAIEGAYYTEGALVGESAIQNIPLTSEKLVSGLLHGSALGVGLGLGIGVPLHALGAAGRGVLKHLAKRTRTVEEAADDATARAQSTLQRAERELTPPGAEPMPEPVVPTDRPMTLNAADLMEVGPPGPPPKAHPWKLPAEEYARIREELANLPKGGPERAELLAYVAQKEAERGGPGFLKDVIADTHGNEKVPSPRDMLAGREGKPRFQDDIADIRQELAAEQAKTTPWEKPFKDVGVAAESPEQRLGAEDVTGGKPIRPLEAPKPPTPEPSGYMELPEGDFGIERFGEKRAWKGRTPAEEAEHMRIQAQKAENARARVAGINERGGVVRHVVEHVDKRARFVDELEAAEREYEAVKPNNKDAAAEKRFAKAQQDLRDLDEKFAKKKQDKEFAEALKNAREAKVANDSAAKRAKREQEVFEQQAKKERASDDKLQKDYERAVKEHDALEPKPKDAAGEAWDAQYEQEHGGVQPKKGGGISPMVAGWVGHMALAPIGLGPVGHAIGLLGGMAYNMVGKTKAVQHLANKVTQGLDKNMGKMFRGATKQAVNMSAASAPLLSRVEQHRYALTAAGTNPDAIKDRVNEALKNVAGVVPNVRDSAVETVLRVQKVLREYMPPPNSGRALNAEFLRIVDILEDPSRIYEHVQKGKITKKQSHAFQKAYPERYGELVDRIVQETIELQAQGLTLPRASVTSLSIFLDKPLTASNSQGYSMMVSNVYKTLQGPPPPPVQGNPPQQNTHTPELDFAPTKEPIK